MSLRPVPITLREAHAFVKAIHRHHKPARGGKFAIGASADGKVVGVVVVGRPVAAGAQAWGWTAEVLRLATDGTKNACSFLYAAAWRACRAMGYQRLITYTLNTEPGVSLEASGWQKVAETKGGSWNCKARPRVDQHPTQRKFRWQRTDGQPMNSTPGAVDDASRGDGLAPSDKHPPSPDGTHRGQSGSSTHPGPAASGNGAGDPTPGT